MNPRVRPSDVGELYPEDYTPHVSKRRAIGAVEKGEGQKREFFLSRTVKWLFLSVRKVYYTLKAQRLERTDYLRLGSESRALDVGCGTGSFLNMLKEETNCQAFGLDMAENAVKAAREIHGLEVHQGTIFNHPFRKGSFDVITAWSFLEHVPNPGEVMREIHGLLKEGGRCAIGIPNARSLNAKVFKGRWYHLDCPRHYHLWAPATIRRLLEQKGFALDRIAFDKTPWGLLGSLQFLVANRERGVGLKLRRNFFLAALLLPFTFLVALSGFSDYMVVHATKRSG